jgi:ribonuclease-3
MILQELMQQDDFRLAALSQKLGYTFRDPTLLFRALVHSSYAFEQGEPGQDNEILEFVGDAVLDLAVGCILIKRYPLMKEGELTRLRAALVNETNLAAMATRLELGTYLYLGKGEDASQGRQKPSILSGTYEAVLGAMFQDSGYESTADFLEKEFIPVLKGKKELLLLSDAKSILQEKLQEAHNQAPTYTLLKEEGPAHDKRFTVAVMFRELSLGTGTAKSKKEAEQLAAAEALRTIEAEAAAGEE